MPRPRTPYYPDYGHMLPTSGPDWRWARALNIVESGQNASINRDGPDIVRAISFIRRTMKDFTGRKMKQMLKDDPDLVLAVRIANDAGRRQLELHARLLAAEPVGVIAVEMGLTKSLVQTYSLMFFDVTDRLGASSYILQRAIGIPLGQPPTIEQLMMMSAYYQGPLVVEPWLDYLDHQCEAHDLTTPEGRVRESFDLLIATHSLPFDKPTNLSLSKRACLVFETPTKMFRRRSAAAAISESVQGQLGEMIWRLPQKQPPQKHNRRRGQPEVVNTNANSQVA